MSERERIGVLASAALAGLVFGPTALLCGIYLDDYSFLKMLEGASPRELWDHFIRYVPGRNLHIPIYHGMIRLTGSSIPAMHALSVLFDALNAALVFLLARRWLGRDSLALAASAVFVLMPNHGETHFWITLVPQCQIPLFLVLASFLLASRPRPPRLWSAVLLYLLALFTYDQVFFLWPLLLAAAWVSHPQPRKTPFALAGLLCLAGNGAHIALRYLSPYASGGRPLIQTGEIPRRVYDAAMSVAKGTIPWPPTPHARWGWVVLAVVLGLAIAVWWARAVSAWAREERSRGKTLLMAGAFGLAWTLLAYSPNLFWYLSPRHSLLPSAGWAVFFVALVTLLIEFRPPLGKLAAGAGVVLFTLGIVANVAEGTQWIDSRKLRGRFSAELRRLDPGVRSLFLMNAPRYLRRAPAFNLYHDVVMAAERTLRAPIETGDYQIVPSSRGLISCVDLTVCGPREFRWNPAAESDVLAYDRETKAFACLAGLELERPDGGESALALRRSAACSATRRVTLDAALLESKPIPAPKTHARSPSAGGWTLADAKVRRLRPGVTTLILEWALERAPDAAMGFVPRFRSPDGALLLDSVFPSRMLRRGEPTLWPLVDDQAFSRGPTRGLRQTFVLAKPLTDAGPILLELELYRLPARRLPEALGALQLPVSQPRS